MGLLNPQNNLREKHSRKKKYSSPVKGARSIPRGTTLVLSFPWGRALLRSLTQSYEPFGLDSPRPSESSVFRRRLFSQEASSLCGGKIPLRDQTSNMGSHFGIYNISPIQISVLQSVDQRLSGCDVGGNRDVMDITETQQTCLIRFARLDGNGVTEKQ